MRFLPSTDAEEALLRKAARFWGLMTGYESADHDYVRAPAKTLIKLLEALSGKEIVSAVTLRELIHEVKSAKYKRLLQPVVVAKDGEPLKVHAYLLEASLRKKIEVVIQFEDGREIKKAIVPSKQFRLREWDGENFAEMNWDLGVLLPVGYHKIQLFVEDKEIVRSHILCRPHEKAKAQKKSWGAFAPMYALKSKTDWGIGGLSEMAEASRIIKSSEGGFFGTLPILSTVNEGDGADPSPYSPVSRLFWNEIYLDVEKLASSSRSNRVRSIVDSKEFRLEIENLRNEKYVDHAKVFAIKKKVLLELAKEFFEKRENEGEAYVEFLRRNPLVEEYAKFRAQGSEAERKYHLFVQFEMEMELLRMKNDPSCAGLYLDYPVGVSRGGFDSHHFSKSFLLSVSAGAPPDPLFAGGQNWGFAPFHPLHLRVDGYSYVRKAICNHMRFSSVLRLDHIMGFHRIYAIPEGMDAKSGTYIRFKADEFYAILAIEASRSGVRIVGEDLGTVPDAVRETIKENNALRMWVLPFEAGDDPGAAAKKAPEAALACLNTHDMIPLAGYFKARDVELFEELGFLKPDESKKQKTDREKTLRSWMKSLKVQTEADLEDKLLQTLAESPAEMILLNLEDLWLETEPQNIPGTWKESPNWRRKMTREFSDWSADRRIEALFKHLTELRRKETLSADDAELAIDRRAGKKNARTESAGNQLA